MTYDNEHNKLLKSHYVIISFLVILLKNVNTFNEKNMPSLVFSSFGTSVCFFSHTNMMKIRKKKDPKTYE